MELAEGVLERTSFILVSQPAREVPGLEGWARVNSRCLDRQPDLKRRPLSCAAYLCTLLVSPGGFISLSSPGPGLPHNHQYTLSTHYAQGTVPITATDSFSSHSSPVRKALSYHLSPFTERLSALPKVTQLVSDGAGL